MAQVVHIIHPTKSYFATALTGYTTMIQSLVQATEKAGFSTAVLSTEDLAFAFVLEKGYPPNEIYQRHFDDERILNRYIENIVDDNDEEVRLVVIHQPIIMPPNLVQMLHDAEITVVNILHDIAPFIANNGVFATQPLPAHELAAIINTSMNAWNLVEDEVERDRLAAQVEHYTHNVKSIVAGLIDGVPSFASFDYPAGINQHMASIVEHRHQLMLSDLNLAPSTFVQSFYQTLGIKTTVEANPTGLAPQMLAQGKREARRPVVVSLFSWEKFDLWHYVSLVTQTPDFDFYLLTDVHVIETLKNLGRLFLPTNLHLTLGMRQGPFWEWLGTIRPDVFLHYSLAAESYGLILDEVLSMGIPFVGVGNVNGLSTRIEERRSHGSHTPGYPYAKWFYTDGSDRPNPQLLRQELEKSSALPYRGQSVLGTPTLKPQQYMDNILRHAGMSL